jgi:hypothetical protein
MAIVTRSRAATAFAITSVVGSGRVAPLLRLFTRTPAIVSLAPARAWTGEFGQSRKTMRSVATSGAKTTLSVP